MRRTLHYLTTMGRCLLCGRRLQNALCPRCDRDLTE